jgi:hypothetical protein
MNNLNIHGRHPKDLPDKMTIDDILLELHDTNKFDINWINLDNMRWRANNKVFHNWLEKGEVITCEMDSTFPTFNPSENGFDQIPMSYATVKETRYDILRHPIRISVQFNPDYSTLSKELIDTSKEVLLRLKDYIGPDVIQDQYQATGFDIDFMISSCKVIK